MSRVPALLVLSACTTATAEPPTTKLETWLDTWAEARSCLVADEVDTRAAVTIGMLTGRDCSKQLHQLDVRVVVDDDPMNQAWRTAIERSHGIAAEPSPTLRALAIDQIDAVALGFAVALDHPLPVRASRSSIATLPAPWPAFANDFSFDSSSFNAGLVHAFSDNRMAIVDQVGVRRERTFVRRRARPFPSTETIAPLGAWLVAAEGSHQAAVRLPTKDEHAAFVVERTNDNGKTWKRELVAPGGVREHMWQDPRTGEITLMVGTKGYSTTYQLDAKAPLTFKGSGHGIIGNGTTCIRDGQVWALQGETLATAAPPGRMQLTSWSHDGDIFCRATKAIVLRHQPDVVERCANFCERVFSAPSQLRGAAGVLDDGRWIYAAALEGIVGVWVEGKRSPTFFWISSLNDLIAIVELGGRPVLVLGNRERGNHASLVSLP